MATLTTNFMTQKDTLVTIKFRPTGVSGFTWEGKNYGPGGEAAGFNGGDTVTLPAYWAARQIGTGRADLVEDAEPSASPFGTIENRDPVESRGRGRR